MSMKRGSRNANERSPLPAHAKEKIDGARLNARGELIAMKQCRVEGCVHSMHAKGLCNMHYMRLLRWGHHDIKAEGSRLFSRLCAHPYCMKKGKAQGLCEKHRSEQRRRDAGIMPRPPSAPVCSVSDCENKPRAKGLCTKHYTEHRRNYGHATFMNFLGLD